LSTWDLNSAGYLFGLLAKYINATKKNVEKKNGKCTDHKADLQENIKGRGKF
jgi:hypothetical protein